MDFSSEFAIVKAGQRLQRTTLKEFRGAKWTREEKSVVVSRVGVAGAEAGWVVINRPAAFDR
jgi:hypothetical protein